MNYTDLPARPPIFLILSVFCLCAKHMKFRHLSGTALLQPRSLAQRSGTARSIQDSLHWPVGFGGRTHLMLMLPFCAFGETTEHQTG